MLEKHKTVTVTTKSRPVRKAINAVHRLMFFAFRAKQYRVNSNETFFTAQLNNKIACNLEGCLYLIKKHLLAESLILLRSTYESVILLCLFVNEPTERVTEYKEKAYITAKNNMTKFVNAGLIDVNDPLYQELLTKTRGLSASPQMPRIEDHIRDLKNRYSEVFNSQEFQGSDFSLYCLASQLSHNNPLQLGDYYATVILPPFNLKQQLNSIILLIVLTVFALKKEGVQFNQNYDAVLNNSRDLVRKLTWTVPTLKEN